MQPTVKQIIKELRAMADEIPWLDDEEENRRFVILSEAAQKLESLRKALK